MTKPPPSEYPSYAVPYVNQITDGEKVLGKLSANMQGVVTLIQGLSEDQLLYRYAEDKWTIKEILVHILDAERIFCYRALRFARNDKTDIPGYDHNTYVPESDANERPVNEILMEYKVLRGSTIALFRSFSEEALRRQGKASGVPVSVRALAYMICGHEMHHLKIIQERYL